MAIKKPIICKPGLAGLPVVAQVLKGGGKALPPIGQKVIARTGKGFKA